jgi:hypothetical protein
VLHAHAHVKKNYIVCLQETKTDDIDKIDLEGYTFKMKNRKKIGRKSGRIILGYKDHLENYSQQQYYQQKNYEQKYYQQKYDHQK